MLSKNILTNLLNCVGVTVDGSHVYDLHVHDERLYKKLMLTPSLGAGEGYTRVWWDCDQLDELFFRIFRYQLEGKLYYKWQIAFYSLWNKFFNLQTHVRSKKVAEKHYNLGNDFYRQMLGETMAYTCAYWKNAETLY